jgi:membrane protein required for colicin V production
MENWSVNPLDLAILGVLAISALWGLSRGFVHEVLAVGAWFGAGLAALYLYKPLSPLAHNYIVSDTLANLVTAGGVFALSLVFLTFLSRVLSSQVKQSAAGPLDRTLGLVFGLARGALVVGLVYIAGQWIGDGRQTPAWARQSRLLPMVEVGVDIMRGLAPSDLSELPDLSKTKSDLLSEKGYKATIRQGMDQLIERAAKP